MKGAAVQLPLEDGVGEAGCAAGAGPPGAGGGGALPGGGGALPGDGAEELEGAGVGGAGGTMITGLLGPGSTGAAPAGWPASGVWVGCPGAAAGVLGPTGRGRS